MDTYSFIFGALLGVFLLWLWSIMSWVRFHRARTKQLNRTLEELVIEAHRSVAGKIKSIPPQEANRTFVIGCERDVRSYIKGYQSENPNQVFWIPVTCVEDLFGYSGRSNAKQEVVLLPGWDLNRTPEFRHRVRRLLQEVAKSESDRKYRELTTIVEPNI